MWLAFLLATASPGVAGVADPSVVQLPAFVVKDNRVLPPPQRWDYAAGPGLEVLTNAGPTQSRSLATDFLRFHRAMAAVWPLERMDAAVPVLLILCGDKERARPFVPADAPAGVDTYLSVSVQDREMAAIVIDLDPELLAAGDQSDTGSLLRGEFIHVVLARLGKLGPWIRQGLWVAFTSMRCAGNELGFPATDTGAALKLRQAGDLAALAAAEKSGAFLPLSAVVAAGPSAADTPDGAWSQECFQFVHYCLFGDPQHYRVPFLQYVLAAQTQPADEALFRRYFRQGYDDFTRRLWHYTGFASARVFKLTGPLAQPLPDLSFRRATQTQAARMVGETLRMQGKTEAARWTLIAPYARGFRDPDLLASLGLAELAAGRRERAQRFLDAATRGGTRRARAWVALARLRLDEALSRPAGPGGRLDAAQLRAVAEPLNRARALPPPLAEEFAVCREALAHAPAAGNAGAAGPSKPAP